MLTRRPLRRRPISCDYLLLGNDASNKKFSKKIVKLLRDNCNRCRVVGRSENPGVPVLFGGHNLTPMVVIGLTDLSKSGGAMLPPAPPGMTPLK